jgi:hypothetical protein
MANQGGFKYLAARYLELWVEIEVGDGQLSGVAIDGVTPERDEVGGGYRHCFGVAHAVIGKDVIITAKVARTSASDHASLTARFYQSSVRSAPAVPVVVPAPVLSLERLRPKELVATATFGSDVEIPLALIVRIA